MKHIDKRIRALREYLGLTQAEFAAKIGIKRGALSQIEIGNNQPTSKITAQIRDVFDINHDWLMTGEGDTFKDGYRIIYTTEPEPKEALPEGAEPIEFGYVVERTRQHGTGHAASDSPELIRHRLLWLLGELKISITQFCGKLGINAAFIHSKSFELNDSLILEIKTNYPRINTTWLLSGQGEPVVYLDGNEPLPWDNVELKPKPSMWHYTDEMAIRLRLDDLQDSIDVRDKAIERADKHIENLHKLIDRLNDENQRRNDEIAELKRQLQGPDQRSKAC